MAIHVHMLAEQFRAVREDGIGVLLSVLCLIHCATTMLSPLILPGLDHQTHTHLWFAAAVLLISCIAFTKGYCSHRKKVVLFAAVLGLSFIFVGLFVEERSMLASTVLTVLGSLTLIYTHVVNTRSISKCAGCCANS